MNGAAPSDRREVDTVDQIVERALVDQPRHIALDRRLRDPERVFVEALLEHAYPGALREQDLDGGTAAPDRVERHEDLVVVVGKM